MVLNVHVEDAIDHSLPIEEPPTVHWSNNKPNKTKPKFTYDDILSSLNLTVSQNGVLQRMSIKTDFNTIIGKDVSRTNNVSQVNQVSQVSQVNQSQSTNNGRIDPDVKHSYIYNKYFKNYSGENPDIIVPRIPKTREEYRQMLLEDAINRQRAKQRAAIVKSTKMLYTNTNNNTFTPTNVNRNNLNRLFRIKQ